MSMPDAADLWWKNAITYCIDVETFQDSDGDGVGDFAGLTARLPYLAGLGVTCIWLMPFYPSPNRDNGYDISDYYGVDPRLGTLGDFTEFMRTATERGIRVIVDLVVNHTSDQHPWFKAARADRESPYHDYYVWSDERPPDADEGMVFPGVEDAIWSYDKEARRWYLHRFRSFQPDLNIANPQVRIEIKRVMGFWLELGVSGFRVDAVPFLIEQVGVRNPAVSDPHDYLRDLRAFLGRRRGDAVLVAEANEPPDRLAGFFGDGLGDQMHVLFNFIVNQALFLSLVRHDARPLIRAIEQMPAHPDAAGWANFVKNHDELSLDKLTDAQRQEVFAALGPDPDMQLYGRGIRRRVPPMLVGDRRRLELLYSLLFTLPGMPVLFYGEEIGLGDDLSQEGRDAVRVPMQWSSEPSAGFSRAPEPALVRPVLADGLFGYRSVNVELEQRKTGSLLNWMERAIRTRKEWPVFGFADCRMLRTARRGCVVMHATWDGSETLTIHNFSPRRARVRVEQPTEDAYGWRHLFGSHTIDDPGAAPFEVTVDGYGYHWFGARPGISPAGAVSEARRDTAGEGR